MGSNFWPTRLASAIATAALLLSGISAAVAYPGQALAGKASIKMNQAVSIATKVRPGKIIERELEKEGGKLRYSFIIKSGTKKYEVGIDATNGATVENKIEGKNPD